MSSKVSFEEYKQRLLNSYKNIIPISEYNGLSKQIVYRCNDCNHEWVANEARTVIRYGCPNCISGKIRTTRITTEEQFRLKLKEKQPNLIPNDTYVNGKTKYHCICKIHGCDVYTTPNKYLYGNQGCLLCSKEQHPAYQIPYTHESFLSVLNKVNPNVEILSDFCGAHNRIKAKCRVCGWEWNPEAKTLIGIKPCGCPKCAGNLPKTTEEFRRELAITHPTLQLLSPYIRSNRKVYVFCNECENYFWVTPNKLQQNRQCPHCNISRGEKIITNTLNSLNVKFVPQVKFDGLVGTKGNLLSYDFYLPDFNLLIEFQGEQHEKPIDLFGGEKQFAVQQEHDKRKRKYASDCNIELLEIWYYEIDNIDNILQEKLIS